MKALNPQNTPFFDVTYDLKIRLLFILKTYPGPCRKEKWREKRICIRLVIQYT